MSVDSVVRPALWAFLPNLNPFEIVLMGATWLVMLAVIGAIFYTAIKVARLKPMGVCPHCGAKL